ncbi:MAG: hypothetical protein M2R45_01224 [Verrucomicrobia subdivision 3 bacterium]|nr:hypothetical protein [Limisphaerales bacterium]MCS1415224.1 hypothetical protein [Limisphaerales bacterium]
MSERLDQETQLLNTDGNDIRDHSRFRTYTMHI